MKYCTECKMSINTELPKCPLCSMVLTGVHETGTLDTRDNGASAMYPMSEIDKIHKYNFLFRLFLFISIVIGSTCLLINLMTFSGDLWSMYIIGTMLYLWITVGYPLFIKKKIGQIIVIVAISTSIYLYALELATRSKGWGLSYVIPFLFIAATLLITFIILLKRLNWREYTLYQTIMIIMGFLPVIFCLIGLVTPVWPSVLSAFYSLLTLTGMFIFADRKYKNELIKRFHL